MSGGGSITIPKPPKSYNFNFGLKLVGKQAICGKTKAKSLQAKSKTTVFTSEHCLTKRLLQNLFRSRGPTDPLSFVFFRFQPWSELIKNAPNSGSQADRPISTNFLYRPIKDQHVVEEAEVGFDRPRTDYVISEDQLPISCHFMHDPQSTIRMYVIMPNVLRASIFDFDQSYTLYM
jgi:hypothetical protein